jgi:hypothetical protein
MLFVSEKRKASESFNDPSFSDAVKGTDVYPALRKSLLERKMERVLPFPSHLE